MRALLLRAFMVRSSSRMMFALIVSPTPAVARCVKVLPAPLLLKRNSPLFTVKFVVPLAVAFSAPMVSVPSVFTPESVTVTAPVWLRTK